MALPIVIDVTTPSAVMTRGVRALAGPAVACILSLLFLKYSPVPYLWMSAAWAIAWFIAAAMSPLLPVRRASLLFASLAMSLFAVEGYAYIALTLPWGLTHDVTSTKPYLAMDEDLGYALTGDTVVHSRLSRGRERVYDATYTIGANGLRVTPPPRRPHESDCILFFGDSFTFGEGVEDRDTSPYVAGELSGYQTYNFSFQGYGPHQMLAWIDSGRVQRIVHGTPRLIVYQALVEQVPRVAGLTSWDPHGPKYIRTEGGLARAGHFDDDLSLVQRQLAKSYTYERFLGRGRGITSEDVGLFVDIVAAARQRLAAAYPGAPFHVILWDRQPENRIFKIQRDKLRAAGISLYLASEILPGYPNQPTRDELSPWDSHPSASAQRAVGTWIARTLLP